MILTISIFAAFLIIYVYLKFVKNQIKLPPGLKEIPIEKGAPIIGILNQIEPPLSEYLFKLSKKHGSIFRIKLGFRKMVILNDFEVMKKILLKDPYNVTGTWPIFCLIFNYDYSGITFTEGKIWSEQRSFVLRVLRDFGFGKSRSLEIVQNECSDFLKELETLEGTNTDFAELIPIYTINIISKFIMNVRFTRDNPHLHALENVLKPLFHEDDFIQLIHMMFPILSKFDWICKAMMKVTNRSPELIKVHKMFQAEIDTHSKRLDMNSEGEDLIDRFLIEQKQRKEKDGTVGTFSNMQLITNAFELLTAGFETVAATLGWSMMFMARHADVQDKVYKEIVDTIGRERMATMNDKKNFNYTQAVMDEILRLSTAAPIAAFHRTYKDTSVDGYFIPKNSTVIPNLLACHRDPKIWEKPFEFYPEHFLRKNENGELKYFPREELVIFGMGKRQCLGESLARMEYTIFFVSIIQRYEVKFVEEISEERYKNVIKGNDGILRYSEIKNFKFRNRNKD